MKKIILLFSFVCIGQINAQYTKLFDFTSASGNNPFGDLYYDGTFLYGMTGYGGANSSGTIFKIKPDGSGFSKLYDFGFSPDAYMPWRALISDGTFLYGMTESGGINGTGAVFKINTNGTGYSRIFDFTGAPNGSGTRGSLFYDGTYLYGLTENGGTSTHCGFAGCGIIFKVKPDGSGYVKLYDFNNTTSDGSNPFGSLISDGISLYGMTNFGGINDSGTVFKIKPDGTGYSKLLDFNGTANGSKPTGSLVFDGTFLYGMTMKGGTNNLGTLFKIKPDGSGYTKLLDFNGSNGKLPFGSLFYDGVFLYGMAGGGANNLCIIFKIKPDGSSYADLYDFVAGANGFGTQGSLISDGTCLYGMTQNGGANSDGVIFKLNPTGIGIEQFLSDVNQILVYPNPTSDQFYIETNTTDRLSVDLCDVNGRHLFSASVIDKESIDVAFLVNGAYTLTIKAAGLVTHKKLVILH